MTLSKVMACLWLNHLANALNIMGVLVEGENSWLVMKLKRKTLGS